MSTELLAALLGLASGLLWGTGDFFGGVASRRISAYTVVFYGQIIGTAMLLVIVLLIGLPLPSAGDLALGSGAGIFGAVGLLFFYRALSTSKMSAAAPVTAVMAAAIPVVFGFALEGMPQIVQIIGMGLAFAAIALIAREGGGRTTAFSELRLPLLAGFGFGMYLVLIARASGDSALWPIVAGRFTSITIVGVIGWRLGKLPRPNRAELRLIAASGVFDTLGNTLYGLSAQVGRDAVAAVLSSLYPAATVTWAWVLLKERLRKHQLIGVAFALAAVVLIAL
ncbi:MAG: DMT family transporter [Anaerolineae bacterium]|nr:EamA family transporter [Chloroflexota bacterium]MBV6436082.1 hypothetical protein [Anaerolineae bacterium]MDL1914868.1 DMT family transporter [Anaerolineae bacterium CFX4]OQY80353.1 MAG: hypothetical protein B6D42_13220 [Anaerolineae bacterium UTCFX5]MBW7878767.1 DMT family transporter [Anaerolineae bacterium]